MRNARNVVQNFAVVHMYWCIGPRGFYAPLMSYCILHEPGRDALMIAHFSVWIALMVLT